MEDIVDNLGEDIVSSTVGDFSELNFGNLSNYEHAEDLFSNILSPEQIADSTFEHDPTYRSVYRSAAVVAEHSQFQVFGASSIGDGPIDTYFQSLRKPLLQRDDGQHNATRDVKLSSKTADATFQPLLLEKTTKVPPEVPFVLMATHFEVVETNVDRLISMVNLLFTNTQSTSFEFIESSFEWNLYYLGGTSHSKVAVHMYRQASAPVGRYIVETNRLSGDAAPARMIFNQLKECLSSISASSSSVNTKAASFSGHVGLTPLPFPSIFEPTEVDESALESIDMIFRMAKTQYVESQLEAALILCDLTLEEAFKVPLIDRGCVDVLAEIIENSPSEWARSHAVVALSNLSDASECQDTILQSPHVLKLLLSLARDGPVQAQEMRRIATCILANTTKRFASRVVQVLDEKEVQLWMASVDDICDERLKLHAVRVKEALAPVLASSA